jgi:hypothetical protein
VVQQGGADGVLQLLQPRARGRKREVDVARPSGDGAVLDDGGEQAQVERVDAVGSCGAWDGHRLVPS